MLKGNDKELYDYTMKMMENITSHYLTTDFNKGTNVNTLIEHGVARKIAAIMPDKYTEVEVTVAEVGKNLYVTATYSIEGDAEIVAIHKEELVDAYTYDPRSIDEDFFFGYTAGRKIEEGTAHALLNEKVSLGVSCRGTDSEALKEKEYQQYDENGNYDPRCLTEDYIFPNFGGGWGSNVETLPGGQGLGEVTKDMDYFREKLIHSLKRTINRPYTTERINAQELIEAPTSCAPMTKKTPVGSEKPTVDFTTISQLSAPVAGQELVRYETGMHVGIDLAKVDVEEEVISTMAKEVSVEIDKQIMNDIMDAAKGIDMSESIWAVPTFGWTEEKTTWDNKPDNITWKTSYGSSLGYMSPSHSPFGGVITTDNTAPTWTMMNTMEEISFSEEELDELIELLDNGGSKVMEFV